MIIWEGDAGDLFYVIERGQFEVIKDGKVTVAVLGEGKAFGELALLHDVPRAASIRALTNQCVLWSVDRMRFRELLASMASTTHREKCVFLRQVWCCMCMCM